MNNNFKRIALVFLALGVIAFLSPANAWWVQWYAFLQNQLLNLLLDGARIIGIALILAGLLAPFEALGWWAGWYSGDRDTTTLSFDHSQIVPAKKVASAAGHYIVYLDGIGKSSFKHSFRVEKFLQQLEANLAQSDRLVAAHQIPRQT